jgi:hypothetical protein
MKLSLLLALALLAGCAHNTTTQIVDRKIDGPRVIALDAPRTPWVVEIEQRLRRAGFKVLRAPSQMTVREQVSDTRTEEYKEAAARYILVINGRAPLDRMHRCFAGGYNFDFLTAELVDTADNETLLNVTGSGYSENCPPFSGRLFSNIVDAVSGAWH